MAWSRQAPLRVDAPIQRAGEIAVDGAGFVVRVDSACRLGLAAALAPLVEIDELDQQWANAGLAEIAAGVARMTRERMKLPDKL